MGDFVEGMTAFVFGILSKDAHFLRDAGNRFRLCVVSSGLRRVTRFFGRGVTV